MILQSDEYWKDRFLGLEKESTQFASDTFDEIEKSFIAAQADIQKDIDKWISRLSKNNNISIKEARKMLAKDELKEFKWSVQEYIKYGEQNAIDGKWIKELENASSKVHITRLEALKLHTQQRLEVAFGNQLDKTDEFLRNLYSANYYKSIFELNKGFKIGTNGPTIDDRYLDNLLNSSWLSDGKNFSSRIWGKKNDITSKLKNELLQACLSGKTSDQAVDRLSKYVDENMKNAKHCAARLIQTEQSFLGNLSQRDGFKELSVSEYEIVATLDRLTSEICQAMDGKNYPLEQFVTGVTAPPFHPWCRSCICPYFDDEFTADELRSARGDDGNLYYVPADMTYPEWKKMFVDGGDKSGLTSVLASGIIYSNIRGEDLKAIYNYMGAKSYCVNESLRNDVILTIDESKFINDLDDALKKMPTYEGDLTRSVIFRTPEEIEMFISSYKVGEIKKFKEYISTTYGEVYNPDAQVLIQIKNAKKGRDISLYNKDELEVVYERNSKFKIIDILGNINNTIVIFLEEV